MREDLEKLRIEKSHRASRDDKPIWPKLLVGAVVLAVAAGLWSWRVASAAVEVKTLTVRPAEGPTTGRPDRVALSATGYIRAAHKIELASKVVGRVAWVGVEMGDVIKKDQELVKLEDDEFRAKVAQQEGILDNAKARLNELEAGSRPQEIAQAAAQVAESKAELAFAESTYERLKQLGTTSSVSQKEVDEALMQVDAKKAQVESFVQRLEMMKEGPRKEQIAAQRATVRQLEGSLELAKIDLANTAIRAPFASTVLERNVEVGEFVTTGFVGDRGAKGYVLSIADLSDLQVELDVSQNDFAKVGAQQLCSVVTDAYPDRKYEGAVDLISPEANRQKMTVQVRVKILKPDALLRPDMSATVSFLSPNAATQPGQAAAPTIRVPTSAVKDGSVFVVEDGQAVKRSVTTGSASGGNVEIRSGLIGGEQLVVAPPAELKDGTSVKTQTN